jgi:UDP-glucose 4-epimerase
MKTYLITGVAGLLGSRLADFLICNNLGSVIGIDDLSGGYKENINSSVVFYERKCQDDLNDIFKRHQIDIVYHFAAYAAEGLSPFIRKFNYENNLKATANIVNFCITHSVQRLVFTSTLAVYGHGNFDIFDEIQVPKPIDPYGVAKYGCEMDIQIAGEQHGLDWCIIRPHNVYGIKQNIWDKYRNVLGIWMYQYLNGEPLSIFGDGLQTRAFSYIDDSLLPLYKAGILEQASKEIINLGGIEESSIINAAITLKEVIGDDRIEIKHFEARHEVKHSIPTWKKSVDILGFEHKTSLKEGLTEMWYWAQKQEMRERFIWSQYEIDKDIYSYWK